MIKKYYILALTFLCLFVGQVSYGITTNEGDDDEFCFECINELEEVVITPEPKDEEPEDSGDPCDASSSAYDYCTCHYPFCEDTPPEDNFPDEDCPSGDECECYGIGCDVDPTPVKDPCTNTCDVGFIQKEDCSCIKKEDDDCKESKMNTDVPSNSNTYQVGDTVTFNGPFYFSDLNGIPKNLFASTGSHNADLVAGYQILEHGNYYEIPSISYKYNQFSDKFNGGTLGGFFGEDCPNVEPNPGDPNPGDPNFDETDYGNSGSFEEPKDSSKADPCKQLKTLTNSDVPANDRSGSNNNLLTANINMLKDKLTNFPIPFTGLFYERSVKVKKNNLDFYSTTVNPIGDNFSSDVYTGKSYIGSIHNHPTNGVALPSIIDLRLLLNTYDRVDPNNTDEVFVMVVSKESNGNLAVYNLKINDIDKLRAGIKAVWDAPEILKITDEELKIKAIKDAEALYYSKAGNDKEKAFFQRHGGLGIDLYKSSNSAMDDWGKLALATDPVTNTLIVKKSNCN
jgi:hypothetical protein